MIAALLLALAAPEAPRLVVFADKETMEALCGDSSSITLGCVRNGLTIISLIPVCQGQFKDEEYAKILCRFVRSAEAE